MFLFGCRKRGRGRSGRSGRSGRGGRAVCGAYEVERLEGRRLLSTAAGVLGYHNDAAGTGANLSETILTPANVAVNTFGKFYSTPVDGQVYAQPLYVPGVNVTVGGAPAGVHDVVYVATEHDSLYAIDAATGAVLWRDSFLVPEAALQAGGAAGVTVTPVSPEDVGADNIAREIGITSTPAIDAEAGYLYLIAKTRQVVNGDAANPHFVYTLYKVDIGSGALTSAVVADTTYNASAQAYAYNVGPYVLDPGGNGDGVVGVDGENRVYFNALRQLDRAAVTLSQGQVFLAFASHGDNAPYHGWILGYDAGTLGATAAFNANPDGSDGGIWMSGGRIAVDPQGYLYVETGNGTFDTTMDAQGFPVNGDYGDSFLKLAIDPGSTPAAQNVNGWGLKVVDYFTPWNQAFLSSADLDLGSGAPLVLPETAGPISVGSADHPDLLIGAGKVGVMYLIDRNNMGRYSPWTDNVVQETYGLPGQGSFDTPAFFYDGNVARIYYSDALDYARSFTIANGVLAPDTVSPDAYGFASATASVSANQTANGIVWDVDYVSGQLRAYDAGDYSKELWTSVQAPGGRDALGAAVKFAVPTVADGRVFVGAYNALVVYGAFAPPASAPAAPTNLTAAAVTGVQVNLAWQDGSDNEDGFYVEKSGDDGGTWSQVGVAGVNATSYSVTGLRPGTSYLFRLRAFNVAGASAYTSAVSATTISPPPALNFSGGFGDGSGGQFALNGPAVGIVGGALRLTDGGVGEAGSAYWQTPVKVNYFTTSFGFRLTDAVAEGFTFTIQSAGLRALGAPGVGLGYGAVDGGGEAVDFSVAVKFDFNNNGGEGRNATGLYVDGETPGGLAGSVSLNGSGLSLRSGDVMLATLAYDGVTLTETITDTVNHATFTTSYLVDVPGTVGGNTAYVGFTAATGASSSAVQDILGWSYTPLPAPPAQPTNLTVTAASGTELDLAWSEGASVVDHFDVFRQGPGDGGGYTRVSQVPGNQLVYADGGLAPGASYAYEVVAVNATGSSAPSAGAGATTPTPPQAPAGFQAALVGSTQVTLAWQSDDAGVTGFKVMRQLGSGDTQLIAILPATARGYTSVNLLPGRWYQFVVSAYNLAGPSMGTVLSVQTLTPAPGGVGAVGQPGQVALSWTASVGATGYNVYRGTCAGGENELIATAGSTDTTFVDAGVVDGVRYYYRVVSVGAGGEGGASTAWAQTPAIDVIDGTGGVTLSQDADGRYVDWSTAAGSSGRYAVAGANGLTINGGAGEAVTITLDYSKGNPLPNLLHLNGGTFLITGLAGSDPLAGTTLDLGRSSVYVAYSGTDADPLVAIRRYLANGYAGGAWTGAPGGGSGVITSLDARSNPLHDTGIGYADYGDGTGIDMVANMVLLKYAAIGDVDLDGTVGLSDYAAVVRNFGTGTTWDQGAVTYGEVVSLSDYTAVVRNFGTIVADPVTTATAASLPAAATAAVDGVAVAMPALEVAPATTVPSRSNPTSGTGTAVTSALKNDTHRREARVQAAKRR